MFPNTSAISDAASDAVLIPSCLRCGCASRFYSSPSPPPSECDVERASCTSLQRSHALGIDPGSEQDILALTISTPPVSPMAMAATTVRTNGPYPQSGTFVNASNVSDDGPQVDGEGMTTTLRPNEGPTVTAILPWYIRALAFLTMYGDLCAARSLEDFVPMRTRLQQEWTFDGGFLLALAAVNAAMFAMTPDAVFKVNSYGYVAVSSSSAACGLGIACDVWFLLRYNWVDLETFVHRSRDIYGSYVFFSLSSRMPTFCMVVSSISLMAFLGLIAYNGWSVGVVVIGAFVVLVMILEFVVYGMHRIVISASHLSRILQVSMANAVRSFRG